MITQFKEKNYSSRDVYVSDTELWIRSIFYTIQGEGPYAGHPAVFVRLAGCNRGDKETGCQFCDTDFLLSSSEKLKIDSIVKEVQKYDTNIVVVTGGEPMMHQTLAALVDVLDYLGYTVQIETNGDYVREDSLPKATIVASPKVGKHGYVRPPNGMLGRVDYLKFVVSADPTSLYHNLPLYVHDFAKERGNRRVFVSPINEYTRPVKPSEIASIWSDMYDRPRCALNHTHAAELALSLIHI